ncbi:hypothetical protein HanLR1_Chr08g0266231 [Helianthus annuus]|nr:hypothetical protein HanHA89_Chr08g0284131 [Helianthus annuus]KAJ0718038.1 hypothetical protein HanLR1_Chr08g0266231 [Helianthus annuus]
MKMNNLKHSGSKEDDQGTEMVAKRKAMVLSFQPVSLTFDYVQLLRRDACVESVS